MINLFLSRFLELDLIVPLPIVPTIANGTPIDANPVDAAILYVANAVNLNAQPLTTVPAGGPVKNLLYNGGFDVWQRGAGGSASFVGVGGPSPVYTADRWIVFHPGGSATVTQVAGALGHFAAKVQRTAGNATSAELSWSQSLEINDCKFFCIAGTQLTFSASIKAGANFSATNNVLSCQIIAGQSATNTAGGAYGYLNESVIAGGSFTLTTSLQRFTLTGTLPANPSNTQFAIILYWNTPVSVAGADDSFTIEQAQLEAAGSASAFQYEPFGVNLSRCQRYYEKSFPYAIAPAQAVNINPPFIFIAGKAGATYQTGYIQFLVEKIAGATTPNSPIFYNPIAANAQARDLTAFGDCSATSFSAATNADIRGMQVAVTGNGGGAVGDAIGVHWSYDQDLLAG